MPEEEVSPIELPLSKRLLQPNNLKKMVIGAAVLILLIGGIIAVLKLIPTRRSKNENYWFKGYKSFPLTSYKNPHYGTFFSSVKVNLAYINRDVREELIEREAEIINKIMDVVSRQNYYKIDTPHKRTYNLTPKLRRRINLLLRSSGGIVDIDYPDFNIKLNNELGFDGILYFDMGNFKGITILAKPYEFEIYLIYQSTTTLFDQLLKSSKLELKDKIKSQLKAKRKSYETSFQENAQDTIKTIIRTQVKTHFKKLNKEVKEKYNNYSIEETKLNTVFFSLFVEKQGIKP